MLKRLIRLEPPYLVSLLLVLAFGFIFDPNSPESVGGPFHFDLPNTLGHLLYLNGFFDQPWANPVYWSLAIEFQFYLMVGLIFPLVASKNPAVFSLTDRRISRSWFSNRKWRACCSSFLPLFVMGMAAFRWRIQRDLHWLGIWCRF